MIHSSVKNIDWFGWYGALLICLARRRCAAGGAEAAQQQVAGIDLRVQLGGGFLQKFRRGVKVVQIHHPVAAVADKMRVGRGIAVEALHAVLNTGGADDALLFEQGQIAVYCAKGEIWKAGLELAVDTFCRRVRIR